jgi:hypothetical protein
MAQAVLALAEAQELRLGRPTRVEQRAARESTAAPISERKNEATLDQEEGVVEVDRVMVELESYEIRGELKMDQEVLVENQETISDEDDGVWCYAVELLEKPASVLDAHDDREDAGREQSDDENVRSETETSSYISDEAVDDTTGEGSWIKVLQCVQIIAV